MTLGHVFKNLLPKLEVSNESKKAKCVVVLNHLGLHKGLNGLCMCTQCLCIVSFPVVLLGKAHVPQDLGVKTLSIFQLTCADLVCWTWDLRT